MRIHRIYTDQPLWPDCEVNLAGNPAHHLARVLRVVTGQSVTLFNGDGRDYAAEVVRPGKNEIRLRVSGASSARPESPFRITVVQAISRGERMDQTLQKCTELGASDFQPLTTERVEVRIHPGKLGKRLEHWRQVVISSCEQCGRAVVPEVREPETLYEWLDRPGTATRLVLAPGAGASLARSNPEGAAEIVVGPEGGFSEAEVDAMRRKGVQPVSLGPRILRTETAGPAAVTVLQAVFGDFA